VYEALISRGLETTIVRTSRGPIDLRYLWGLIAVARRRQIALIQSHLLTANLYCAVASRLLGIPAVATFHGMVDIDSDDKWAKVKMRLIASNASQLVFVSESLRRHVLKSHPVLDGHSAVIHNGVDTQQYCPAPSGALRSELGCSPDTVIVTAVGNVRPAKGYEDLLRTAAIMRNTTPMIHFVIVGERTEPLYLALIALRRELGLEERVTFLGFKSDVADVLNGSDIYLNCSTSEGFSLTTIQAMSCSVPVVATRSGGPEEIIDDGVDGVLVAVSDVTSLASALTALSRDAALRRRLGESGRVTVLKRFSLQRTIGAYEAIYDGLLGR